MMRRSRSRTSVLLGCLAFALAAVEGAKSSFDNVGASGGSGDPARVLGAPVRHGSAPATRRFTDSLNLNGSVPTANLTNILDGYQYFVDLEVGTPPQKVSLIFDTGSDQSWLNPSCDTMTHEAICATTGRYNFSASSTAKNLSASYTITYGSGSVEGWYFRDDFQVAGAKLAAVQFGVAGSSWNLDAGILGLGYDSVFMDELQGQGVVETKDFSFSLGPNGASAGHVVFGGIDVKKFHGRLHEIPMLSPEEDFSPTVHYSVNLTYVGVTAKGSCVSSAATDRNFFENAIVDTGSTINHLPWAVANATAALIPGARFDAYTQMWKVSCHYADEAATVEFGFGDVVLSIPIREFVFRHVPGGGVCYLGIVGDADSIGFSVLGDTFLRAFVALYRPDKGLLYLGHYVDCGSELVSAANGTDDIRGKCKRASWDTCGARPRPIPLAPSSTSLWQPSSSDWMTWSGTWPEPSPDPFVSEAPPLSDETEIPFTPPRITDPLLTATTGRLHAQDRRSLGSPTISPVGPANVSSSATFISELPPPVFTTIGPDPTSDTWEETGVDPALSTHTTTCLDLDGETVACPTSVEPLPTADPLPSEDPWPSEEPTPTSSGLISLSGWPIVPVPTFPACLTHCVFPSGQPSFTTVGERGPRSTSLFSDDDAATLAPGLTCATYCRTTDAASLPTTASSWTTDDDDTGTLPPLLESDTTTTTSSFSFPWTEGPLDTTWDPITIPLPTPPGPVESDSWSWDWSETTTTNDGDGFPTPTSSLPWPWETCYESSLCALVLTTLPGSSGVTEVEDCYTYSTCEFADFFPSTSTIGVPVTTGTSGGGPSATATDTSCPQAQVIIVTISVTTTVTAPGLTVSECFDRVTLVTRSRA